MESSRAPIPTDVTGGVMRRDNQCDLLKLFILLELPTELATANGESRPHHSPLSASMSVSL